MCYGLALLDMLVQILAVSCISGHRPLFISYPL